MAGNPLLELPFVSGDLERVESALHASVRTADDFLTGVASHLIGAGGKRLRPVLTVTAAATGMPLDGPLPSDGVTPDDVIMGGVAVELVHLGSLYHDDVIDEATTRRSVESVNARWGNLRAILAGDFLLAKASEIAASLGTEVAGLLARTIGLLCEGEVRELQAAFDVRRSVGSYIESIDGKTAALFAASARIGGIVAGLARPAIDGLTEYARALGMVFQIADDVLDLISNDRQLGKPAGHDIVQGVYTLPVLYTLESPRADGAELRELLGKPIDGPELDKALGVVRANGSIRRAVTTAREWAERGTAALEPTCKGVVRTALESAPHALLEALPV